MKKIIKENELKKVIKDATNYLCDAVSSTLGPSGNNVIINSSELSPYITNDGVTIAKSIESEDERINSVLEILKEASLKTDEKVGDGTTTTLVLMKSIINEGFKEIEKGVNPVALKNDLLSCIDDFTYKINKLKRKTIKKDYVNIASTSLNDKYEGAILAKVFKKMKNKRNIRLDESKNNLTYFEIKKGYSVELDNISNLYFQNTKEIVLNNVSVLISRGFLESLEQISDIINEGFNTNKNIIIFVEEVNECILEEMLLYYLKENKNIFIFKLPEYSLRRDEIELDIEAVSQSKIKNVNFEKILFSDLGVVDKVIIEKELITLSSVNAHIENRIKELKNNLEKSKDDYEREFIENRISKLENGIATIYIGGITKTEIKEKMMRFMDALCALEVSKNGFVYGEGITLLMLSCEFNMDKPSQRILKKAFEMPFNKIIENSGKDILKIKNEIIKNNFKKIYNVEKNAFENIFESKIIDPVSVVIEEVKNAISISSLLLTTNYLVINENKITDKDIL